MVFLVEAKDESAVEGVVWRRVGSFDSFAEAEAERKKLEIAIREPHRIREVKDISTQPEIIVVQTREQREAESKQKRALERQRLAQQAIEKVQAGQQISIPEQQAFKRLTGQTLTQPQITPTTKEEFQASLFSRQQAIKKQPIISGYQTTITVGDPVGDVELSPGFLGLSATGKPLAFKSVSEIKNVENFQKTLGGRIEKSQVGFFGRMEAKIKIAEKKGLVGESKLLKVGTFGASIGVGFAKGIVAPFRLSTYKEIYRTITNPRESFAGFGEALRERPERVLGETIGYMKGWKFSTTKISQSLLQPSQKIVAGATYNPIRPKVLAEQRQPLVHPEFKIETFSRALTQAQLSRPSKPDIKEPPKIEVFISDMGQIKITKLETPKPQIAQQPKISAEPTAIKSAPTSSLFQHFQKLGERMTKPQGKARELSEKLSGRRPQELLLVEEEVYLQAPKIELRYPSIQRIKAISTFQIFRPALSLLSASKQISISKSKVSTITQQQILSATKLESQLQSITKVGNKLNTISRLKTITQQKQISESKLTTTSRLITVPESISMVKTISILESEQLFKPKPLKPLKPFTPLQPPKLFRQFQEEKKFKNAVVKGTKPKFKYTPSVTAITFQYKKKLSKKIKGLTGLEIRPIPL